MFFVLFLFSSSSFFSPFFPLSTFMCFELIPFQIIKALMELNTTILLLSASVPLFGSQVSQVSVKTERD